MKAITPKEQRRELIGLLESAIEGCLKPYIANDDPERIRKLMTVKASREWASTVRADRKAWNQAEAWKGRLRKQNGD